MPTISRHISVAWNPEPMSSLINVLYFSRNNHYKIVKCTIGLDLNDAPKLKFEVKEQNHRALCATLRPSVTNERARRR